jgi:hypothetical protein
LDPLHFNENKRKLLGEEVYEGFMHPKKFKVGKIELKREPSKITIGQKKLASQPKEVISIKKHKFQLV